MTRSACLLLCLLVVLFCSVRSRDVSSQNKRSLEQKKTKLENHAASKPLHYNFYGGEKRMILPIHRVNTKTFWTQSLSKRHKKQRKNFGKKNSLAMMHLARKKPKDTGGNDARTRAGKKSIENAFKKDSLVSLLQAFEKTNTGQFKRSNETVKVISNEYESEKKTENPKDLLHEVLENALHKQTSDEKIAADEIKLGLRKIVSELKSVLKQDSVFLKNSTKARHLKKVDLEKLISDVRAKQNKTRKDKSDKKNDESIELTPQQKLLVSDLHILKELNLDGKLEKQKSEQEMQMKGNGNGMNAMSGGNVMGEVNGMNGMINQINGMNAMQGMNQMNGMNPTIGMNEMNAMSGRNPINGINVMNGMNGMNDMNGINGMNAVNGINEMNAVNGLNGMNRMNELNAMNEMNAFNGMNGMRESYPNSGMLMNNLPRLSDRNPNQNIMYSLSLERFHDEPDQEQEEPEYHHYPRYRPHYYRPYEEDEVDELRHEAAPRYRDEEADEEEEADRARLGEYENADERATITGQLQIKKHGYHHNLLLQKKSLIGAAKKALNKKQ